MTLNMSLDIEAWPLAEPFRIAGRTFETVDVLIVTLAQDGCVGRGEAAGVYFRGETPVSMARQIEAVGQAVLQGVGRADVQALLPAGGARNALDCALWDLGAKLTMRPAWLAAGLPEPIPIVTNYGCGADTPARMAKQAADHVEARAIKLKLTGDPEDAGRVRAVREARPDVWLSVDANQGFTRPFLEQLTPVLVESDVSLIEQPFPVGKEAWLDGLDSPIPIAADESVATSGDIAALVGRVDVINIKLDKCGGLTEALVMARTARALGLKLMVGNMLGTSLAMAPAFLVGQLCDVVDLDGPMFLTSDRAPSVSYLDGRIMPPPQLWGYPASERAA